MGANASSSVTLDFVLQDLTDVTVEARLGGGRFMKAIRCSSDAEVLVCKVFIKPVNGHSLTKYAERLEDIKQRLARAQCPNVAPFEAVRETERAAFVFRPFFHQTLRDRMASQPPLTTAEKHWITFQILQALVQMHENGVCHGDIKAENVLLTSFQRAIVSDIATAFKPSLVRDDNPSDFSYFYNTSGRRTASIAPERLQSAEACAAAASLNDQLGESGSLSGSGAGSTVQPAADIFAAGCVIAELALDGAPLFDFSQLLSFCKGELAAPPLLSQISDQSLRRLAAHMTQREPERRLSAGAYVARWARPAPGPHEDSLPDAVDDGVPCFPSWFPSFAALLAQISDEDVEGKAEGIVARSEDLLGWLDESCGRDGGTTADCEEADAVDVLVPLGDDDRVVTGSSASAEDGGAVGDLGLQHQDSIFSATELSSWSKLTAAARTERVAQHRQRPASMQHVTSLPSESTRAARGHWTARDRACALAVLVAPITSLLPVLTQPSVKTDLLRLLGKLCLRCAGRPAADEAILTRAVPVLVATLMSNGEPVHDHAVPRSAPIDAKGGRGRNQAQPKAAATAAPLVSAPPEYGLVRGSALAILVKVLEAIRFVAPAQLRLFTGYLFPTLAPLSRDQDVLTVSTMADMLARLIAVGEAFARAAERGPDSAAEGAAARPEAAAHESGAGADLSTPMAALREACSPLVVDLLTGASPMNRSRLLAGMGSLAHALGPRMTNDLLLPQLIAVLNEHKHSILRCEALAAVDGVAPLAGAVAVETFLLPCILRVLADADEAVVAAALTSLERLAEARVCRPSALAEVAMRGAPLLCHPSAWVRGAALRLVGCLRGQLSPVEVHALLLPAVGPFLQPSLAAMRGGWAHALDSPIALLVALRPPVPRHTFEAALSVHAGDHGDTAVIDRLEALEEDAPAAAQAVPAPASAEEDTLRMMRTYVTAASMSKLVRAREWGSAPLPAESRGGQLSDTDVLPAVTKTTPVHIFPSHVFANGGTHGAEPIEPGRGATDDAEHVSENWAAPATASAPAPVPEGPGELDERATGPEAEAPRAPVETATCGAPREGAELSAIARLVLGGSASRQPPADHRAAWNATTAIFGCGTTPTSGPSRPAPARTDYHPANLASAAIREALPSLAKAVAAASTPRRMATAAAEPSAVAPTHPASGACGGVAPLRPDRKQAPGTCGAHMPGPGASRPGSSQGQPPAPRLSTSAGSAPQPSVALCSVSSGSCGSSATLGRPEAGLSGRYCSLGWQPRKPRGTLMAQWRAHAGPTTALAIVDDHTVMASGGGDGVVRLWPTARFGTEVVHAASAARALPRAQAVTCLNAWGSRTGAMFIAGGGKSGAVEVLAAGGGGLDCVRRAAHDAVDQSGGSTLALAALHVGHSAEPLLVSSNASGAIRAMDLRMAPTAGPAWATQLAPREGLPRCIAPQGTRPPSWLVVGSSTGLCFLWDLRMGIESWARDVTGGAPVTAMLPVRPRASDQGPGLFVGMSDNGVLLHELGAPSEAQPLLALRPAIGRGPPLALAGRGQPGAEPSAQLQEGGLDPRWLEHERLQYRITALVAPPDGAFLLTAGTDGCVRCWDRGMPRDSRLVCGPPSSSEREFRATLADGGKGGEVTADHQPMTVIEERWKAPTAKGYPQQRASAERTSSQGHYHAPVRDMLFTSMPHGMLAVAGADGTVKIMT